MNIATIAGQLCRAANARPAADLAPGDRRQDFLPDLETRVRLDDDGLRARLFSRPAGSTGRWAYHGTFISEVAAMTAAERLNPRLGGPQAITRSTERWN